MDYNERLKECSKILKEEEKCDYVFAVNHMRTPQDMDMLSNNNTDTVDLIFGGHDHDYMIEFNEDTDVFFIRSGTDF